jgi:tripartite-type tricarboxylate transporter receptor subunit TctC
MQQVPFRGSSLVITDVMGGRITMSFMPPITGLSLIREGKIRTLAVTSLKRTPFLADIPTMDESGFPGFDVTVWFGLFVPAGTSAAIIERLHRETAKITALPEVRDRFNAIGIVPLHNTPAEFVDLIKAEMPYWARVIKDTGIKSVE